MKEIINLLLTYKIDAKYRRLVYVTLVLLVLFHAFVLVVPFIPATTWAYLTEGRVKAFQTAASSLGNLTLAMVALLIIFEGQNGMRLYILKSRLGTYRTIREEILTWMRTTRPQAFDANDTNADFIYGDNQDEGKVLQHLKVSGSADRLLAVYGYPPALREGVVRYSQSAHFEFTRYPAELLYGIHFEMDSFEVSSRLAEAVAKLLNLSEQSADLVVDKNTPKQPGWVFMTRHIDLSGDIDKDYAMVMTHARHFVELVCHGYDYLYSKEMVDLYLQLSRKT